ncbi:MAG: phospholipase D-like domain-containing protein [Sediminibacterium sp.]|nr:phospholipase D-like domain-containing protein [Sediminibacterium sp.]MDP3127083.1 phospholipase D-like domain-containing protein [Sediminibacterium sp.]
MPAVKHKSTQKYSALNKVALIRGGKAYFDLLLKLINQATESIHLQTYIYDDDETGRMVADALKTAVKRNVEVYLLADGYASQSISRKFKDELIVSGIHFRLFEPLFKSRYFYFGRRMHHKICVTDMRFAVVGGINISNRYNDMPGKPAWFDLSLYAEGEIAKELCELCWKTWNNFPAKVDTSPCSGIAPFFSFRDEETCLVRMRRNDWVSNKNEISATYSEMFRNAHSHITILCSYFLPGKVIRRLLSNAAKRGVKIKVITAGRSDIMLAKHAERWLYDWLLRNNITLNEYQPAVLHAKIAICDSEWLTIGSYNLNDISAYASIELNLDVRNPAFAAGVEQTLETIIQNDCIAITKEKNTETKNIVKQFVRWFSYKFIRILFHMVTFYYKRKTDT